MVTTYVIIYRKKIKLKIHFWFIKPKLWRHWVVRRVLCRFSIMGMRINLMLLLWGYWGLLWKIFLMLVIGPLVSRPYWCWLNRLLIDLKCFILKIMFIGTSNLKIFLWGYTKTLISCILLILGFQRSIEIVKTINMSHINRIDR